MKGGLFTTYARMEIRGLLPERALMRLRKANIPLYDVRKPQKDLLTFCVKDKDKNKVFAAYQSMENITHYAVRSLGKTGVGKGVDWAKRRLGFILGGCLFCIATLFMDGVVLGVDFTASNVYQREALAILEEHGVKTFACYKRGKEDLICARLLKLDGVEFCSIKKSGLRLQVEMRVGNGFATTYQTGDMQAKHTGTLLSLTALKGERKKSVGDRVNVGETLVGEWIESETGGRKTQVIARASIACEYECVVEVDDERTAFALAYFEAGIESEDRLIEKQIAATEKGFQVKLSYIAVESFNL